MLLLYTDFGYGSYYAGQMEMVCRSMAPTIPCVALSHQAPRCNPRAAAILLAALATTAPAGAIFICVVDPEVGSARRPLLAHGNGCWFVGPDNGLMVAAAGEHADWFQLDWRPDRLSNTFHGRDLFAPAASKLALAQPLAMTAIDNPIGRDWPTQLSQVIDIDRFGNLITGLQGKEIADSASFIIADRQLCYARCFSVVAPNTLFWYRNSIGLIEIAANNGNAAMLLQAQYGDAVEYRPRLLPLPR